MSSPAGSSRWNFLVDSDGKRIKAPPSELVGSSIVPVKETPPHALSHANTETSEEQEERDSKEREARTMFDTLTVQERNLLRRANTKTGDRSVKLSYPASSRDKLEEAGWAYVKKLKGSRILMVKSFPVTPSQMDLAREFGMSLREVRRRLNSVSATVVKLAIEKGWF